MKALVLIILFAMVAFVLIAPSVILRRPSVTGPKEWYQEIEQQAWPIRTLLRWWYRIEDTK
jgi:hypothetical protein